MINPWVLLGVAIAWGLSLFAVGSWQRADGAAVERAEWQARDNAALTQANETIERLNREARAREEKNAADIAAIGAKHAQEKENLEERRRRDVTAARDGAIKLRVAGACPARASGSEGGPVVPATGGGDDATTAELPPTVAANLLDLVNEADAVVVQLTACQATITTYLKGGDP